MKQEIKSRKKMRGRGAGGDDKKEEKEEIWWRKRRGRKQGEENEEIEREGKGKKKEIKNDTGWGEIRGGHQA